MTHQISSIRVLATLRDCVDAATRLGRDQEWVPAPGSASARVWEVASTDWHTADEALARTVAEADIHALALIHSGLEHASLVAATVSRKLAYAPHTIARTAEEHLLRALDYHVTNRAHEVGSRHDQLAIAEVRFNQVLSNLSESERLNAGLTATEWADSTNDETLTEQWDEMRARVDVLGWKIDTKRKIAKLAHTDGRTSTMELAAKYLGGKDVSQVNGPVITQLIARTRGSASHGYETGLLSSTQLEVWDDLPFAALSTEPKQMGLHDLTFNLMTVPLSVANAVDALAERFGWTGDKAFRIYEKKKKEMMVEAWVQALNAPDSLA